MAKNNQISHIEKRKDNLSFEYIKSNHFRVIHSDGIHGGVTPNGRAIQIAFFNERQPIPRRETFSLKEGRIDELLDKEIRGSIVREVEVEVLMGLDAAEALYTWLGEKINLGKKVSEELKK